MTDDQDNPYSSPSSLESAAGQEPTPSESKDTTDFFWPIWIAGLLLVAILIGLLPFVLL